MSETDSLISTMEAALAEAGYPGIVFYRPGRPGMSHRVFIPRGLLTPDEACAQIHKAWHVAKGEVPGGDCCAEYNKT